MTTEQQSNKSGAVKTLESWFQQIETTPKDNLWNSPEPTIHIRSERLTWVVPENAATAGDTSRKGILKIDYIPEDVYLIPATLTKFLANFAELKLNSTGSLVKIIFNGLRYVLGQDVALTISVESEDAHGNIEIQTLSSGDFPKVTEPEED